MPFFQDGCQTGKIPLECLSGHSGEMCVGAVSPGASTEDAGPPAVVQPGSRAGRRTAAPRPQRVRGRPTPPLPSASQREPDIGCSDLLVSASPNRNRLWIFPVLVMCARHFPTVCLFRNIDTLSRNTNRFCGASRCFCRDWGSFIISHCSTGTSSPAALSAPLCPWAAAQRPELP